ncbi:MAG TPA: wax ester/triacylglycerol synthase family O-acyltransferase [Candidatus Binatia bacterium]|nr:wax ester/triacylglycerol synthase family O-acyltransferase [Candidatus Binatia bacterium]
MPGADRMTALDAAFYHLERTGQLLHVGGVYTVEGALDFPRLVADVEGRLPLIPRYTQRAVPVPFNLANPSWEPDPRFDVRNHVVRHVLRSPGDEAQLVSLVGRLFAQPLDRNRPLWELHQIDGYGDDRSVLFAKVHHCMIDGVSGVQLLGVMFDPSPRPAPVVPPEPAPPPPPLPSATAQALRALGEAPAVLRERARTLARLVRRPGEALAELSLSAAAAGEMARLVLTGTPATPFNGHVSVLRRVLWTTFPLNGVKAIKNRLGGTVNDVVLTVISSALRGYLEDRGFNPDRIELRAMCPVNTRPPGQHGELGNRVSALVVPLPIGIFDPLERLRQVRAATAQLKRRGEARQMTRVLELVSLLPPILQRPLGWLQTLTVPFNTICTNVPGPPVSLYVQGKRLEVLVPIVPLAQGVGLAFAILSYADTLTIGLTVDPALVRAYEDMPRLLRAGYEELRGIAGVEVVAEPRPAPAAAARRPRPIRVA